MSTKVSSSGKEAIDPGALRALDQEDEAAWLDVMARLAAERRHEEFDSENLNEFLASMPKCDGGEVQSRRTRLLSRRWERASEPRRRSGGWRRSIDEQRHMRMDGLASCTLRNYAEGGLAEGCRRDVMLAASETGIAESAFPGEGPRSIDDVLEDG